MTARRIRVPGTDPAPRSDVFLREGDVDEEVFFMLLLFRDFATGT